MKKSNVDFFIRQTAKMLMIPENVVDRIIKDQWKNANKAANDMREVEVNGLGIFYPSPKKMATHITKLKDKHIYTTSNINGKREQRFARMTEEVENNINILSRTKNYDKAKGYLEKQGFDIERYKEQCFSKGRSREGSKSEDGNM